MNGYILIALLLGSNAFWLYQAIDTGVTLTYRDQRAYELEETSKQLMIIPPRVAKNMIKEEILLVASDYTNQEVYEKDGCTWVGWLGFKFDNQKKLKSMSPLWSFGEKSACYPVF